MIQLAGLKDAAVRAAKLGAGAASAILAVDGANTTGFNVSTVQWVVVGKAAGVAVLLSLLYSLQQMKSASTGAHAAPTVVTPAPAVTQPETVTVTATPAA